MTTFAIALILTWLVSIFAATALWSWSARRRPLWDDVEDAVAEVRAETHEAAIVDALTSLHPDDYAVAELRADLEAWGKP